MKQSLVCFTLSGIALVHVISDTSLIVITIKIVPSQSLKSYFLSTTPANNLI